MSVMRRFLIAPSLARLIRKERGSSKLTEGYFAPRDACTLFVRMEGTDCHLVRATTDEERHVTEEPTEVPCAHGKSLLEVCSGTIDYERTTVPVDGADARIDRYISPAGLDVVSVAFDDGTVARAFRPPIWFGDEVSSERAFEPTAVAIDGAPARRETTPSNASLDAVMDLLEFRQDLVALKRPRMAA